MDFVSNPALIGVRLKELRTQKRATLKAVGERIRVSMWTVHKWESGEFAPDYWNLIALAQYFDVSIDYLAGFKAAAAA